MCDLPNCEERCVTLSFRNSDNPSRPAMRPLASDIIKTYPSGVTTRKCSECTTSWTKHERLRAGMAAPPLMAAARVAAGVTSLTCQEPTFTGPLPNRRSRPFPALQDRSYEWVAPTRKRPPAESASSATFLIRPNMVSSPPYRAVALADNRPPELGQEVQMLVVQWAKQQKVREGRPEPRR